MTKQERDLQAMREAITWLEDRGISYKLFRPHQLKIGAINFWPCRGTITIDGEIEKRAAKGISGLFEILKPFLPPVET